MKKIMILLLTVAMALSLAACGTTASNESGAPTESSASQSAALTESTEQIIADIYAQKKVDLDLSTLPVDLTDEYAVEHDLGLKDGSVIKEASVSEPDIFSGGGSCERCFQNRGDCKRNGKRHQPK